eukprot:4886150-Lingulodinium_polyedra.AAC.1
MAALPVLLPQITEICPQHHRCLLGHQVEVGGRRWRARACHSCAFVCQRVQGPRQGQARHLCWRCQPMGPA